MFSASFIWEPGEYDDEFHRLNGIIDDVAAATPGFLGSETWRSADGARNNAIYYWDSLESLQVFSRDPVHREAKRQYSRWYKAYHVVVAEVLRTYGDGGLEHVTLSARKIHESVTDPG
jgi:heme-degrading monooxygenase HmoA